MALPTTERLKQLLTPPATPCISVYLPTHRRHPENQQDPIRFKNLVSVVEDSLREKYRNRDVKPFLEPFHTLFENRQFWNHTLDGLAVLAAGDFFETFSLRITVPERAVVADSFHIKPLLRAVQTADRYQVLGITRHKISFWEGDRYGLDPVDLTGFPATIEEALGEELTEPHHGMAVGPASPQGSGTTAIGHGSKKDEVSIDMDRFFRFIDKEVLARFSKPAGVPLVLVGLPENVSEFRKRSKNPHLMAEAVLADPGSFTGDKLRAAVWDVVLPQYLARLDKFKDDFHAARDKKLASADLSDVARAVTEARVGRLLIDGDKVIPGKLLPDGQIQYAELNHPEVDDVLDDMAERALRNGSEVYVVPHDRMPTDTGLAAIFRY